MQILVSEFADEPYLLAAYTGGVTSPRVSVLFKEHACDQDVITGLLHLHVVRRLLHKDPQSFSCDGAGLNLRVCTQARDMLYGSPGSDLVHKGGRSSDSLLQSFTEQLIGGPDKNSGSASAVEERWSVDSFVLEKTQQRLTLSELYSE